MWKNLALIVTGLIFVCSSVACEESQDSSQPDAGSSVAQVPGEDDELASSDVVFVEPDSGTGTAVPDAGATAREEDTPGADQDVVLPGQPTEAPPVKASYTTFIGDWTMAPGKETTRCVVKRLDNEEEVWMSAIHAELAKGSHHMIVYRTDETEEVLDPEKCDPFTETLSGQAYPLLITQVSKESLSMPHGVAVRFEPQQMVRIEAHFLNYYPEEIVAHGDVTFDTIAEEDVWQEANMLFYGNVDIDVPPGQEWSTPWTFMPIADGIHVFGMTGHTHQYGVNVEVNYASGPDAEELTPIYPLDEAFEWDEAPVIRYEPPVVFGPQDGVNMRCTWDNTSDESLGFGESANEEMCFFWAYYYPSSGYRICVELGGVLGNLGDLGDLLLDSSQVCCPGDLVCDLLPGLAEEYL